MASFAPAGTWLADAFAPLTAACGDRLVFVRDGQTAQWSLGDRSVVVSPSRDGSMGARFVDRPATDAVTGSTARAVYGAGRYPATELGCSRMVDDMLAFFRDAADPRFTFLTAL